MGFPRDSCAYAGGACDVDASGSHFGDGAWDVDTYMAVNHAGVAYNPIPAGWDLNGDGQLSRYEVYQWELTEYANNVSANENAAPICHASPAPTNPDRRVITVAVVNCTGITGTETVTPIEWVELFLTEPMGVFNGNNDLYGEIIGPGQDQGDDVMKFIVQLVE
jgi:hypothetical protein